MRKCGEGKTGAATPEGVVAGARTLRGEPGKALKDKKGLHGLQKETRTPEGSPSSAQWRTSPGEWKPDVEILALGMRPGEHLEVEIRGREMAGELWPLSRLRGATLGLTSHPWPTPHAKGGSVLLGLAS